MAANEIGKGIPSSCHWLKEGSVGRSVVAIDCNDQQNPLILEKI